LETLNERAERGIAMREMMAGGNPSHYTLPGIDQLAPDLKRIIDEALWGSVWTRPGLDTDLRSLCTVAALIALGQVPLLRRNIERSLNLGVKPDALVEVCIQMTFFVGIPAVETAMRITKEVFEEQGVEYTPTRVYDTDRTVEELHQNGLRLYDEQMGRPPLYPMADPHSVEMEAQRFIEEYHWGAIHARPGLDAKSRALCGLSAMTVLGQYDRQIRRLIEGALHVGATPQEIMEVFFQLIFYGSYTNSRTAMLVARSVFVEQGVTPAPAD
jgi:4-carboxymuconolactone decarboxylase